MKRYLKAYVFSLIIKFFSVYIVQTILNRNFDPIYNQSSLISMRKITLLFLLILVSLHLAGKQINAETAKKVALTQLNSQLTTRAVNSDDLQLIWTGSPVVRAIDGAPFYLFSNKDGGFALIAGDDRAYPVLGYSTTNQFDPLNLPPHIAAWIDQYKREIDWLKQNAHYFDPLANDQWQALLGGTSTGQLIKQIPTPNWDQGQYYYKFTPTLGGKHTYVGCVATAIGIFMKATSTAPTRIAEGSVIEYVTIDPDITVRRTLPASYRFDLMPTRLTLSSSVEEVNAVANLLADCGAITTMKYDTAVSVTRSIDIPRGMIRYFGYDKSAAILFRDYYTEAWENRLIEEIVNDRPIIYSGNDINPGIGHAFILDGYTNDTPAKFAINFGWSGICNGIYSLNAILPQEPGIGGLTDNYSYNAIAVTHLIPAIEGGKYVCNVVMDTTTIDGHKLKGLTTSTTVFTRNTPFNIMIGGFGNLSVKETIKGELYLIHTDQNGNDKGTIAYIDDLSLRFGYTYYVTFNNVAITNNIASGDKIRAYIVPTETDVDQSPVWLKGKPHVVSEINLTSTSVQSPEEKEAMVFGSSSGVVIKGESFVNQRAYIYNLSGMIVDQFIVTSAHQTRALTKGTYIVKIGSYTRKITL